MSKGKDEVFKESLTPMTARPSYLFSCDFIVTNLLILSPCKKKYVSKIHSVDCAGIITK